MLKNKINVSHFFASLPVRGRRRLIFRGFLLVVLYQLSLSAHAQQILTLDKALEIADTNSPDIRKSLLNLEDRKSVV